MCVNTEEDCLSFSQRKTDEFSKIYSKFYMSLYINVRSSFVEWQLE